MTPADSVPFLELWYAGLRARIGVRIATSNYHTLMNNLYTARRIAGDPDLQALSITPCPANPLKELWIVHKTITITVPDDLEGVDNSAEPEA